MTGRIASGVDIHVDVPLSNLAVAAFADQSADYIGDRIAPNVPVGKESDKYYVIEKNAFLATPVEEALRAKKTKARKVEFTISSESYHCHNYMLANELAIEDLANADLAIQLRENSVKVVVNQLRTAQELRIANIVTSATNCGSGVILAGSNKWSDYVNSDPISAVNTAHAFIRNNTGLVGNTMVIDYDTLQIVRRHPVLLDLYKYTSGGQLGEAELKSVFKVQEILVGMAVVNRGNINQAASMSNVWGNNVVIMHRGPSTGLMTKTPVLRFEWRPAGIPAPFSVQRAVYDRPGENKVEIHEVGHWQDTKVVAKDLMYCIAGTL